MAKKKTRPKPWQPPTEKEWKFQLAVSRRMDAALAKAAHFFDEFEPTDPEQARVAEAVRAALHDHSDE